MFVMLEMILQWPAVLDVNHFYYHMQMLHNINVGNSSNNDNNEILIKHMPLVYPRAWRCTQKKEKGEDCTTAITSSS